METVEWLSPGAALPRRSQRDAEIAGIERDLARLPGGVVW